MDRLLQVQMVLQLTSLYMWFQAPEEATVVRNNSAFSSKCYQTLVLPVSIRLRRQGPHWLPDSLNIYKYGFHPLTHSRGHQWPPSLVHHLWLFCGIWPPCPWCPDTLLAWLWEIILSSSISNHAFPVSFTHLPKITIWQELEGVGTCWTSPFSSWLSPAPTHWGHLTM